MKKKWYHYPRLILLSILIVFSLNSFAAQGVYAAGQGLRVSGALLVTEVTPGETLSHTLVVGIGDTDLPSDIIIQIGDIGQALDGGYQLLSPSSPPDQYSASAYISADISSFHLKPGASREVKLNIHVPSDAGPGGRYALVNVRTVPVGQSHIGMVSAVNIPIYLTIKNSRLSKTGKITKLSVSQAVSGRPIDISTLFQNTGNHHYKAKIQVSVSDHAGKKLAAINQTFSSSSILPNLFRELKTVYIPDDSLAPGRYHIVSKVLLEDGTLLDEASGQFEVAALYLPPPAPVSLTLLPSSAGVLQTEDGRIAISFPKGSVLAQTQISLRSYPFEQLAAAPAGYWLAGSCYKVDGLTGLLTQKAMIKVRYSEADLKMAGGNASRLVLARWDESSGRWTVVKTSVDKNSMTLSASTNRFSIWAVMAGKNPQSANWPLIGAAAGLALIGLAAVRLKKARSGRHGK